MKKIWAAALAALVTLSSGVWSAAGTLEPSRLAVLKDETDIHMIFGEDEPGTQAFTSGDYQLSVNPDRETVTLTGYTGQEERIEIPAEIDGYQVTEIGYQAFTYIKMKSLSIPDSVRLIGQRAFEYCEIPDSLRLPENVTVCEDAFSYAVLPSAVTVPAGTTTEECAFSYCEDIENLFVESGAVIGSRSFGCCRDLTGIACADGSRLQTGAFEYCTELQHVILCGDVETEADAFYGCENAEVKEAGEREYDTWREAVLSGSLPAIGKTEQDPFLTEKDLEILGSPASQDGVTLTLDRATAKRADTGGFAYSFGGTIENGSEEGIMQVVYTFALTDENGEEFRSFAHVYDGEDEAIPPHTTIDFTLDGVRWGPQSVPASVRTDISSVKTETELPPARVPKPGESLYLALADEKLANIKKEPPAELSFHVDQGGYGRTAVFGKGPALDRAVELLCNIVIGPETGEWVTDNYNWIGLTWEDGSHSGISLNLANLEYFVHSTPHTYQLEHLDEFWSYAAGYLKEDGSF